MDLQKIRDTVHIPEDAGEYKDDLLKPPTPVVLFDIDGTLARASSLHLESLSQAIGEATGRDPLLRIEGETPLLGTISVAGWIDAQCIREGFRQAGLRATDAELASVVRNYADHYRALLAAGSWPGELIEGAREALTLLRARRMPLGLLTGNCAAIAEAKLSALGIAEYFAFTPDGGFGDRGEDRSALPPRAARLLSVSLGSATLVVGDTETDMKAARAHGCTPLGVTTGSASRADLIRAGAERVLGSVAEVPAAVEDLLPATG